MTELEIKIAFHEELIDSLNSTIAGQQKQIRKLEETCKLLHEKISSLSHTEAAGSHQIEIPPHY